jgi:hypothetical protein
MGAKIVLLLGAGASVADVATWPRKSQPPLDSGFFSTALRAAPNDWRVHKIQEYLLQNYGINVLKQEYDSLEGVMARLYPDLYNGLLEKAALESFQVLLRLFVDRLAITTNDLKPTQRRFLYRILNNLLWSGVEPKDITIITFNQDLQVEKTLEYLSETRQWKPIAPSLFAFPGMYAMPANTWRNVTRPTKRPASEVFARSATEQGCLHVLKLHGSLNWYSTHTSKTPSRTAMFDQYRRLSVTQRKTINPDMTIARKRKVYAFPVIVPPVSSKSLVFHKAMAPVWALAEERLIEADHLVIFGYSCPALDFESANLLTRAQLRRAPPSKLSVIDPNGAVATRYIDLLGPSSLSYYANAKGYLAGF